MCLGSLMASWRELDLRALIVVGRGPDWNDVALARACKRSLGHARLVRAQDLSAYVGPDGVKLWHGTGELEAPDVCFVRSLGSGTHEQLVARLAVLRAAEELGSIIVNPVDALERARDKFSALLALRKAGFAIPRTYLTELASVAYRLSSSMREFVFKPIAGSLGFGSMLFGDRDLAFNVLKVLEAHGCPLYIQEFLRGGREFRILVLAGEVVACAEKVGQPGSWKKNVAQGARMKKAEAPEELQEMCVRATEELGLFYAGLDVVELDGLFMALEANAAPNWRGLQECTGLEIAKVLVGKVLELLKS